MSEKILRKIHATDRNLNIVVPVEVLLPITTLRVTHATNQSAVVTQLLTEALRARGIAVSYPPRGEEVFGSSEPGVATRAPVKPVTGVKTGNSATPKAKKIKSAILGEKGAPVTFPEGSGRNSPFAFGPPKSLAQQQAEAAAQLSLPVVVTVEAPVAAVAAVDPEAPILPPFNIEDPIDFKILATEIEDLPLEDPFACLDDPDPFASYGKPVATVAPTPAPAPAAVAKEPDDLPLEDPFASV